MYAEIADEIKKWLTECETTRDIDNFKTLVKAILTTECENKKHEHDEDYDLIK